MNNEQIENQPVSPNTLKIGMVSTILFVFINILSAITIQQGENNSGGIGFAGGVRLIIYYFLYASIWYSMREVLVKVLNLTHMYSVTTWMLRLVIISGLFTLAADSLNVQNLLMMIFIIGLALLGVFINFMIRVMQLDYHAMPEIKYLRYFVISFIVLFILLMIIELLQYKLQINLKLISNLLYALPFIFVYIFFKEIKEISSNN